MGKGKPKWVPSPNPGIPALEKHVPAPLREFRPAGGDGCLRVRFSHVDVNGPWCLTSIERPHFVTLLDRLKSFETMKCSEIFSPGSEVGKIYPVADLPNMQAGKRLEELELDDQTEIARLRITGERRLYGLRPDRGPDFWVLWWDPKHEIWPSTKRNT